MKELYNEFIWLCTKSTILQKIFAPFMIVSHFILFAIHKISGFICTISRDTHWQLQNWYRLLGEQNEK